jgi:WD40 repeat protein
VFVYIFQSATGAVLTRLGPLPDRIRDLAVSPDGRYLAAALGAGKGLRVWERKGEGPTSWLLVAKDEDYDDAIADGATFGASGILYTVADNAKLRRYEPGYTARPLSVTTKGGKEPGPVAVHPAGDRVAVSFDDTTAVEVYDATTLTLRFAADTRGVRGNLGSVAWSADGARLYAGGEYGKKVVAPYAFGNTLVKVLPVRCRVQTIPSRT